jgi:hypothetical protein
MKIGDLILLGGLGFLAFWLLNADGPLNLDARGGNAPYTTGSDVGGTHDDNSLDDCNGRRDGRNSRGHVCGPIDVFGFRKRGW